jgi:hypothetical protein
MVRLSSAVFATVAALVSTTTAVSTSVASGYVSSDGLISFALNIPQADDSNDLYFTMSGSSSLSWIAVGMGSDRMKDSLIFMIYSDSTGKNVTMSPRLSYGEVEPSYTSNISVTALAGTGISNGNMTFNGMCTNCRSWKGGSIDPTNTAAKFIWATGPDGSLNTNNNNAGIKRHATYGAFQMDLTKAYGIRGVPIPATADTSGTKELQDKTDHDFSAGLHAAVMILAFVIMMPGGVVILRILNKPRWHGYHQSLSMVIAILGSAGGVYIGTMYNRTKNYQSAHQIFGTVIALATVGQFLLGFFHHRIYKQTLATTKLAPIHVWLGRLVIPAGIVNGFLGFPLALNSKYNWALLALCLLLIIVGAPFAFWRWKRNLRAKKNALANNVADESDGATYQSQPWMSGESSSNINLTQMNYPPQPQRQAYPPQGYPMQYDSPEQNRQFV